jgi:hypothetical protein
MTRRARPQMVPARALEPGDVLPTGGTVSTVSVSGNDGTTIVHVEPNDVRVIWSGQHPVGVLR